VIKNYAKHRIREKCSLDQNIAYDEELFFIELHAHQIGKTRLSLPNLQA
jgi:hypothetical protein